MKKNKLLVLICGLVLISTPAIATIWTGGPCDGGGCNKIMPIDDRQPIHNGQEQNQNMEQGQGQSQGQGIYGSGNSSSDMVNSGNSKVEFKNSFNGSKPIRYTPSPSNISFGNMPSLFTSPNGNKGHNFIPARNIIDLVEQWNVMSMKDDDFDVDDVDIDITFVGSAIGTKVTNVRFCIQGSAVDEELKAKGYKPVAIGSINTDETDVNSPELYMALVKKAEEIGAGNVVLMSEGVELEIISSGWGLGASYNYASVNSDQHGQGSVGAGGTGYSKGKAHYEKKPFLTFTFIQ